MSNELTTTETKLSKKDRDFFAAHAGEGNENVGTEDLAVPYLSVVQDQSGVKTRGDENYNADAREGMIYNTLTGDLYDGEDVGVTVIPCAFEKVHIEKKPGPRGEFIAEHPFNTPLAETVECTDPQNPRDTYLPNGNELVLTHKHYVLLCTGEEREQPVIISFRKGALATSRKWNSRVTTIEIDGKDAPRFAKYWNLTTVPRSNEKGNWFGLSFQPIDWLTDPSHRAAAVSFTSLASGGTGINEVRGDE